MAAENRSPGTPTESPWQHRFIKTVATCVVVLLVIHAVPKSIAPFNSLRKFYTLTYFGTVLGLCWLMLKPRSLYYHAKYADRFRDWPTPIERGWRRYLASMDRSVGLFARLAGCFVAATAVSTLSLWTPKLQPLVPLANLVWWLSLIGLFMFVSSPMLQELAQRRQVLEEEVSMMPDQYKPQSVGVDKPVGSDSEGEGPQRPVTLIGPGRFRAGGWEWTWKDFNLNCVVFGQTGSGKTVCVLNAMLEGLLGSGSGNGQPTGGLILDPKGDFCDKIQVLCARLGRERDLFILDPADPRASARWNPLDSTDDELELASRFAGVMETLGMKSGDTSFWIDNAKRFIQHAISLLRLTNRPGQPPTPRQVYELASGFTRLGDCAARLDVTDPRCDLCLSYFAEEWCDLAPETRTSIQAHITSMLNPFLMEPYATLFSGRSSPTIRDVVRGGKILYVHMPVAEKEAMARMVATFIKLEYFREILRARDKATPSVFFCDEFQKFMTVGQGKGDADFFEVSRQSGHANVIATQNLPALRKQTEKEDPILNLLGNCASKVFLRNTDKATNEYGAEQWGEVVLRGGGGAVHAGKFASADSPTGSDQREKVVHPDQFRQLAVPDREHGLDYADAIVLFGARWTVNVGMVKCRWKVHPLTSDH